jgi:transposase-like protein
VKCKHVWAVEISIRIRKTVDGLRVITEVSVSECHFCHSRNLKRYDIRWNKSGDIQRFICADCHRTFSINIGFDRMKHNPKAITAALQLYFSGESLRNTQKALRLLGTEVSHKTVLNWIKKYVRLMDRYLSDITPQVGQTWRADEVFVKFKGKMKFLFALMDDETRFWIAQQVADGKFTANVKPLFAEGKRYAGKRPLTLITDGGPHFVKSARWEFYDKHAKKGKRTRHIKEIRLSGSVHNNKMERMNGEIRDREKVMRSLKRTDTPILKGLQIYHNFVRPHMALNGQTPADRAGIKIEGSDKWFTLIQNASLGKPSTEITQEQQTL